MGSLILLILIYGSFTYPMQKQSILEVMHSEAKTLTNSIALVCDDAVVTDDDSFIVEHNLAVIENNPDIFLITVSKRDGTIIKTQKGRWQMPEKLTPIFKPFEKESEQFDIIHLPEIDRNVFHYTAPIRISGIDWGWIHVDFSLDKYHQNMHNMLIFLLYLTIGSMIVVLLVSYLLSFYILNPILELSHVAGKVAQGDLGARVTILQNDEIGDLAQSFNRMINNLAESKKALKESHAQLEQRVEERTRELAQKSHELEELNRDLDKRVKEESEKSRKNEQLLIQQSRQAAMGEMIGNIAHQWRQPLNALGLVLQNIHFAYQMDNLSDEFMQKSVEKGKMLTASMSKTIDDFRNFFKPNKLKERFSIAKAITDTIGLIEASYNNHNITLKTDLDTQLIVEGYPSEFSQVILNILSNAKDALIENEVQEKRVYIKTESDNTHAIITIKDTAGGIPEAIIDKIFDPYFSTKEEGQGTGIGLYMSRTIIETNMSGKLTVSNSDTGACFTIKMPIHKVTQENSRINDIEETVSEVL